MKLYREFVCLSSGSQIEGFKRVGEKFGVGETDIRPRIHDTMPVELAYRVGSRG